LKISVVGLGYVGLPLAVAAAQSGFEVAGIDINEKKIKDINNGIFNEQDVSSDEICELVNQKKLIGSTDFSHIRDSQIILICVPTPLISEKLPDLSFIENAVKSVAKNLAKNSLLILESTVAPGTTRNYIMPLILEQTNYSSDEIQIAFSPERIDPANVSWGVKNTPKIVAGLTLEALETAASFYSKFVINVIKCSSLEIAETAKLLENSFRYVNISFVNELSIFCQKLGVDVNEVIKAASTKPYGFMPFYPSIGVGGHCIPVDPLYLANKAREIGAPTRFIDLADQINQEMPGYFVGRAEEKIGGLKGKKVLVIGVSYKPNVADVRETPVEALILGLKNKGAEVFWHDDLVKEWNGEKSVALSDKYDLAILATPHAYLDLTKLRDVPILNTRGSI
jgi:UDP-N-acetyl-D-glucosamine dehydrogenase